ncbi:DUF6230 family protein [Streptomyces physcomitrii]|uniref:Cholesterol esterase n=1 Tax=Streptomyces physcomitrii TaxID=2724184 RepID=A0ABX1H443_9ACTN|nr:DUF6230 family protein [Streptomyces physcomitrii]NKI43137.1 cholesterol esterase [Streptomyces physcomitrii]
MKQPEARSTGHTSWKRLAFVAVPTALLSGVLIAGVGAGVVPAAIAVSTQSLALSGQQLKISADSLNGRGFAQYVDVDSTARGDKASAVTRIDKADIRDLCQSTVADLPGVGKVTTLIRAGRGDKQVHVDGLVIRTNNISGDAEFRDIVIGNDANTSKRMRGAPDGSFGQEAERVRITKLRQDAIGVRADLFKLSGLKLSVKRGDHSCY